MLKEKFSQEAAELLIDIGAVSISVEKPFTLTSGEKSPVYVDCRKIISFPKERKKLMKMATWKNIIEVLYNRKIPESRIKSIESFLKNPNEWKPK